MLATAVAGVLASSPVVAAETAVTEYRTYVVGGGKPRNVVEGQNWGTYAMLRDATGKRVGDASLACVAQKVKEKRVIADCTHTLRINGVGMLLLHGTHHYRDQTVMPGTADPMRLMITGGSGTYAHASGQADVTETPGGYTYKIPPTG
ncbi:MAG: hypothetical protein HOV68_08105 [Streptomycetaceae bacterium]|nr:hypothetical protein [Streptomycetaceae bacterium]